MPHMRKTVIPKNEIEETATGVPNGLHRVSAKGGKNAGNREKALMADFTDYQRFYFLFYLIDGRINIKNVGKETCG